MHSSMLLWLVKLLKDEDEIVGYIFEALCLASKAITPRVFFAMVKLLLSVTEGDHPGEILQGAIFRSQLLI